MAQARIWMLTEAVNICGQAGRPQHNGTVPLRDIVHSRHFPLQRTPNPYIHYAGLGSPLLVLCVFSILQNEGFLFLLIN